MAAKPRAGNGRAMSPEGGETQGVDQDEVKSPREMLQEVLSA